MKPLTLSVSAAKLSLTIMLLELLVIAANHHVRRRKLMRAAVDFWASWDMHHEHMAEWQSETSSQPSRVENALDKFLAKLCFLRKSNPPL